MTGWPERLREIEKDIFGRRPEHAIHKSLDRITALVSLLGDPHRAFPVIHLTGTNGKTSTARMTEALLRARGLRTGLFTSPHLSMVGERIVLDGEPLSGERFVEVFDEIKPYVDLVDASHEVPLSFFEVLLGMAFAVFADAPVDVCVLEVGMGGTWDNTNIADGAVAVVTPISLDHTRYLGSTVGEIAADKSGIIKPGAIAVLAQQPPEAAEALLRRCVEVGAVVAREGLEFGVLHRELAVGGQLVAIRGLRGDYPDLYLPLFGAHQAGNLACAIAAVEAFAATPETEGSPGGSSGPASTAAEDQAGSSAAASTAGLGGSSPRISTEALDHAMVRQAVAAMASPGRLETVRRSPAVIVDSAHNPGGMLASMTALTEAFSFTEVIAILAVAQDKDVAGILAEMEPVVTRLVVTGNSSSRSMDPVALAEVARAIFGPDRVSVAARLDDAIENAVTLADEADAQGGPGSAGVLITGSVITAGDARLLLVGGGRGDAPRLSGRDGAP
jgi:folylpolyglutamate synthase/dihydropteroate synthase